MFSITNPSCLKKTRERASGNGREVEICDKDAITIKNGQILKDVNFFIFFALFGSKHNQKFFH